MLDVKKSQKADAAGNWPASLYARPRLPLVPTVGEAPIVPEAIL